MKKQIYLLGLMMLLWLASFGQLKKSVFHVPDSTTAFNTNIPDGFIIFDESSNKLWRASQRCYGTDSLAGITKVLIADATATGDGNGIYDGSGLLSTSVLVDGTGSGYDLNFVNLGKYGVFANDSISLTSSANIDLTGFGSGSFVTSGLTKFQGASMRFITSNNQFDFYGINDVLRFDLSLLDGLYPASPIIATWQNFGGTVAWLSDIPTLKNIYLNDDTLISQRNVFLNDRDLMFSNNDTLLYFDAITNRVGIGEISPLSRLHVKGTDATVNNYAFQASNSVGDRIFRLHNNGFLTMGQANTEPASNSIVTVGVGSGSGSLAISMVPLTGNNTTSHNGSINWALKNNLGTIVNNAASIWVRPRSVTSGSVYAAMVLNNSVLTENSNGSTGRTVIANQNHYTSGNGGAILTVKNFLSDNNTILQVRGADNGAGLAFAVMSNDATADTWNWRLQNNHSFIHNYGKLATGDFQLRGATNQNVLFMDASNDNIGIGTGTPNTSSILDLTSTTKGFLMPRMDTAQRNAISTPSAGLQVYNTTTSEPDYYDGTKWVSTNTGIEEFFLSQEGAFGIGGGWADEGFISDFPTLLFDGNVTEKAVYMFYGLSRVKLDNVDPVVGFVIYSTGAPVTATGDSIVLQLEARYVGDGELLTGAASETIQQTVGLATLSASTRQANVAFTLNKALISNQDVIHLTLSRIGGNASDNYASDLGIGQSRIIVETTNHN